MKKYLVIMVSIIMMTFTNVYADNIQFNYSEWSQDYPSGIPDVFIQSEVRYHFYKIVDGQVEYDEGYYTDLPGYEKDEYSARTYYRYITNEYLRMTGSNEIVRDISYCQKSFCYVIYRGTPVMVNTDGKVDNEYDLENSPIVSREAVPYTIDKVTIYLATLGLSILLFATPIIIKKRRKEELLKA